MNRVAIDGVEPGNPGDGIDRRRLSDPLETANVAINHYRIAPGEGFPSGLHAHADQEEAFVVLAGKATFEVLDGGEGREVAVNAGEAVRFGPDEFQSGRNGSDDELVALALGAPRDTEDVRFPLECPDCGGGELRLSTGGNGVALVCPDCGAAHVPAPCPECGADDLHAALGEEDEVVVACSDCGATFEDPPLR